MPLGVMVSSPMIAPRRHWYIRSVKDQLPREFYKDIERAERAMLRLVKVALEEQPPTGNGFRVVFVTDYGFSGGL